jgi:hypothetical protein
VANDESLQLNSSNNDERSDYFFYFEKRKNSKITFAALVNGIAIAGVNFFIEEWNRRMR